MTRPDDEFWRSQGQWTPEERGGLNLEIPPWVLLVILVGAVFLYVYAR